MKVKGSKGSRQFTEALDGGGKDRNQFSDFAVEPGHIRGIRDERGLFDQVQPVLRLSRLAEGATSKRDQVAPRDRRLCFCVVSPDRSSCTQRLL